MPKGRPKKIQKISPDVIAETELNWLQNTKGWQNRAPYAQSWKTRTAAFVTNLGCCAICGLTVFGDLPNQRGGILPQNWKSMPLKEPPDYAFANPALVCHMQQSRSDSWYHCRNCAEGSGFLDSFIIPLDTQYRHAVTQVPPMLLQGLSCVDSAIQVRQKYRAFAEGIAAPNSFMDSPLVSDAIANASPSDKERLLALLADSILHNQVIKHYKTIWEMSDFLAEFPVLSTSTTDSFMRNSRMRGPLNALQDDAGHSNNVALLSHVAILPSTSTHSGKLFQSGRAIARTTPGNLQLLTTTVTGKLQSTKMTLEALMFPYLFPDVNKVYSQAHNIHSYIKYRSQQMFSLVTFLPQYIFYLYQVKQALSFDRKVEVCLEHEFHKVRKKHPNATEEEIMTIILKEKLPNDLQNSPAYFKKQLKNLLAMVKKYGMPTLFVTFTADERSGNRWTECEAMEHLYAKVLQKEVDYRAMPVENAQLFVQRLNAFFKTYILGEAQILGKIT